MNPWVVGVVLSVAIGLLMVTDTLDVFEEGVADTKEGQTDTLITRLRAGVQVVFSKQRDLGDDTNLVPLLIKHDKVPTNALDAAGTGILHPYGGAVTILGDDERMALTLADLDDDQCARAAVKLVGGKGVVNIEVADEAPDEVNDGEEAELTPTGVSNACAEGDGANFLTFTFR